MSSPGDADPAYVSAGPQPSPGTRVRGTVDPTGTRLVLGDLSLAIPPGSVPVAPGEDKAITITAEAPTAKQAAYSNIYRFEPDGLTFTVPVEVRIPFSGNPAMATILWSRPNDENTFDPLPTTIDGAFAVARVSHFSRGMVGQACVPGVTCTCQYDLDCSPLYDGNLCAGYWYCQAGLCKKHPATIITCDTKSDSACVKNTCNPKTGKCEMNPLAEGAFCDDGIPCTTGEICSGGVCGKGASTCECLTSSDCDKKDDGNPCTGTWYCDTEKSPYLCTLALATVIKCPTDNVSPCHVNTCNPAKGGCEEIPAPDGSLCNDGNACTAVDTCVAGACKGTGKACECVSNEECAALEDGNLCNGTLFCNKVLGKCELNPATTITCPSANDTYCVENQCNPKTGKCAMVPINEGKGCDDGNLCTTGETCTSGACTGAWACECTKDADCTSKSDGKLCAGTYYCDHSVGKCALNPATVIECPTGNDTACQKNTCDNVTGTCSLKALPDGTTCSDGDDICTKGDSCQAGVCKGGPNTCDCKMDVDCATKPNPNLCAGTFYCNKAEGICVRNPATAVTCQTVNDTTCSKNRCVAATGLCQVFTDNDGKTCTPTAGGMGECSSGTCQGKTIGGGRYTCATSADCLQYTGGNKCVPMECHPTDLVCNRLASVACDTSKDSECGYTACAPATGLCTLISRFDGTSCGGNTGVCTAGTCGKI